MERAIGGAQAGLSCLVSPSLSATCHSMPFVTNVLLNSPGWAVCRIVVLGLESRILRLHVLWLSARAGAWGEERTSLGAGSGVGLHRSVPGLRWCARRRWTCDPWREPRGPRGRRRRPMSETVGALRCRGEREGARVPPPGAEGSDGAGRCWHRVGRMCQPLLVGMLIFLLHASMKL